MILVALGANLPGQAGEPAAQLAAALDAIDAEIGRVVACSRFYDSPSWPDPQQPRYLLTEPGAGYRLVDPVLSSP